MISQQRLNQIFGLLDDLDTRHILELKKNVDSRVLTIQQEATIAAIKEFKNKLESLGLNPSVVLKTLIEPQVEVPVVEKKKLRKPVRAKYIIDGVTWTGRGLTPVSIAKKIEKLGITIEEFKLDPKYRVNKD